MLRFIEKLVGWFGGTSPRAEVPPLLGLDGFCGADPIVEPPRMREVHRRLAAMPVMMRETYLLRTVDGMSIDQIARRLAISRDEVARNLRRAIGILLRTKPRR
jgi:DNA-directed RNA polymerase specialized sigma24 family protein